MNDFKIYKQFRSLIQNSSKLFCRYILLYYCWMRQNLGSFAQTRWMKRISWKSNNKKKAIVRSSMHFPSILLCSDVVGREHIWFSTDIFHHWLKQRQTKTHTSQYTYTQRVIEIHKYSKKCKWSSSHFEPCALS